MDCRKYKTELRRLYISLLTVKVAARLQKVEKQSRAADDDRANVN